jgi:putative transposase
VAHVVWALDVSERRACRTVDQPRSSHRYEPKIPDDEAALTIRIIDLAKEYGRYG